MHQQKVVAGASDGQLGEVEADATTTAVGARESSTQREPEAVSRSGEVEADAPRRVGTGRGYGRPAGGRWSTLTRWHVGQVRMYSFTAAGRPDHHTKRRPRTSGPT